MALGSDGNVTPIAEMVPAGPITKKLISLRLPDDLIERVKNAVYHLPGITMCDFAEDAFSQALDQLERSRGEPFPKRSKELKKGRPIR